jgi:hypothetical protein
MEINDFQLPPLISDPPSFGAVQIEWYNKTFRAIFSDSHTLRISFSRFKIYLPRALSKIKSSKENGKMEQSWRGELR